MDNFRRNIVNFQNYHCYDNGDRYEPKPTSSAGARRLAKQKARSRREARRAQKTNDRRDERSGET